MYKNIEDLKCRTSYLTTIVINS